MERIVFDLEQVFFDLEWYCLSDEFLLQGQGSTFGKCILIAGTGDELIHLAEASGLSSRSTSFSSDLHQG